MNKREPKPIGNMADAVDDEDGKPKTFSSAFEKIEEARKKQEHDVGLGELVDDNENTDPELFGTEETKPDENVIPDWVTVPPGFSFAPHKDVGFLRFRKEWTDRPDKGDRHCIVWGLSLNEEAVAIKRTRGEMGRQLIEQTKLMIRAFDGLKVDWTGRPQEGLSGNVNMFLEEIGPKCRSMLLQYFVKTHNMTEVDTVDFFMNCLAVRSAVVT